MALRDISIFGETDKVAVAIKRLQAFEPKDGYYLAFSGGKDSIVIKKLADLAGVKYDAHYSVTTADPPELIYYIREHHPDVIFERPDETMWQLIPRKRMPPTRLVRYCCEILKERGGMGRVVVTGVRWAESASRGANRNLVNVGTGKNRQVFNTDNDEARRSVEHCYKNHKTLINPIIDWLDEDVWEFIHLYELPYCELYDQGYTRLGCIGCPMAGEKTQKREFERWPKFKGHYLRAFQRMVDQRIEDGLKTTFKDAEDVMDWWLKEKDEELPLDEYFE